MSALPRNKIESLVSRYKMHPGMVDIYVEGKFDKDFLELIIFDRGLEHLLKVYEINTVEIPNELIEEINRSKIFFDFPLNFGSNKHRLISLAYELSRNLKSANVTCLADADCDRLLSSLRDSRHLFYTDYVCIETYALSLDVLKKFFKFQCNLPEAKADEFILLAEKILPAVFVLRAVNEELGLNSSVPSYTKAINKKGEIGSFDIEKLIRQYIDENQLQGKNDLVRSRFADLMLLTNGDIRNKAHGHDFIELLYDFSMSHGSMKFASKEVQVREHGNRILMSNISTKHLFGEKVFARMESALDSRNGLLWP